MGAGKNKIQHRSNYLNREEYNKFIEENPTSEIQYKDFIEVLKESTKEIRNNIVDNPLGFKLPHNLGYIAITKYKPLTNSRKPIDWIATNKYKRVIPLTNFHSLGNMYKIVFYPNESVVPMRLYIMKPHRILKRLVAKNIKDSKSNYISIDKNYFNKRFNIDKIITNKK